MLRFRRMHGLTLAAAHSSVSNRFNSDWSPSGRDTFTLARTAALDEGRALRAG